MGYAENLRNDLDAIESMIQMLGKMHKDGVDRTSAGCQSMALLCVALDKALTDLGTTTNLINKNWSN